MAWFIKKLFIFQKLHCNSNNNRSNKLCFVTVALLSRKCCDKSRLMPFKPTVFCSSDRIYFDIARSLAVASAREVRASGHLSPVPSSGVCGPSNYAARVGRAPESPTDRSAPARVALAAGCQPCCRSGPFGGLRGHRATDGGGSRAMVSVTPPHQGSDQMMISDR